jgi:hypothetical protein
MQLPLQNFCKNVHKSRPLAQTLELPLGLVEFAVALPFGPNFQQRSSFG